MSWWRRLRHRHRAEAELDAELRDHIERQVTDHVRAGMSAREARRRARLEFGASIRSRSSAGTCTARGGSKR